MHESNIHAFIIILYFYINSINITYNKLKIVERS